MATAHPLMRLLIVDDEPPARERARRLLERVGGVAIIGEAADGREALAIIEREQPDVVLLDIQMPGLDGIRLLEALDDPPAVIFSTAYEHHAVRAFDMEAVDYLLKPYSAERLAKALDRVRRQLVPVEDDADNDAPRIPAEDGLEVRLLDPTTISAARIEEGVVFLLTDAGERLCYARTLNDFEDAVAGCGFFRVSRQALVNLAAIESVSPEDGGGIDLRLRGGFRETASRRRGRFLKERLGL